MAHYKARITLPYVSGLSTDVAVNTLSFAHTGLPDAGDSAAVIQLLNFNTPTTGFSIGNYINDYVSRSANACELAWYDRAAGAGAPPVRVDNFTLDAPSTITNLPGSVALALSFHGTLTALTANKGRHRGRVFLGPFITDACDSNDLRPTAGLVTTIAEAASQMLVDTTSTGLTWEVWSTVDAVGYPVVGGWVDNQWDTMQSRDRAASSRQVWS